jgi:hypothetical protein
MGCTRSSDLSPTEHPNTLLHKAFLFFFVVLPAQPRIGALKPNRSIVLGQLPFTEESISNHVTSNSFVVHSSTTSISRVYLDKFGHICLTYLNHKSFSLTFLRGSSSLYSIIIPAPTITMVANQPNRALRIVAALLEVLEAAAADEDPEAAALAVPIVRIL